MPAGTGHDPFIVWGRTVEPPVTWINTMAYGWTMIQPVVVLVR